MNPKISSQLEFLTPRLHLREFTLEDWPLILNYQKDSRYLRFYPMEERSQEDVRAFVQKQVNKQSEKPRRNFQMIVMLKDSGRLIGNCGVRKKKAGSRDGDLGYEFAPDHWGRGYATEAAQAMLDFGFNELKLHRIWAKCYADNTGSWRVMEKVGMRREGHLRKMEWFKNRWWHVLVYAILAEDWYKNQAR